MRGNIHLPTIIQSTLPPQGSMLCSSRCVTERSVDVSDEHNFLSSPRSAISIPRSCLHPGLSKCLPVVSGRIRYWDGSLFQDISGHLDPILQSSAGTGTTFRCRLHSELSMTGRTAFVDGNSFQQSAACSEPEAPVISWQATPAAFSVKTIPVLGNDPSVSA